MPADVRKAAQKLSLAASKTLETAMKSPKALWAARISAAVALTDRGWGKPARSHEIRQQLSIANTSDADLLAIVMSGGSTVVTSEESEDVDGTLH